MTLRGDIREYFQREAAVFPTPAGLRQSVRDEASRARELPGRGTRLVAIAAAFVAVAIAAGLVAVGTLQHNLPHVGPASRPSPTPTVNRNGGGPTNGGRLVEIDFVDLRTGFALLCTNPNQGQCQYWVTRTTDGGVSWLPPVKVGAQVTTGESGHHIHFANAHDGLMYGNSTGYVSHDGGRTWSALKMKFLEIVSIEGSARLWMVIYPCDKGVPCPFQVLTSTDGAHTWTGTSDLPQMFQPLSVASFGTSGLLMSTYSAGDMLITRDGGVTWSPITGRCKPDSLTNRVGTADGAEIWQMCTPLPPDSSKSTLPWTNYVYVSQDGGAHWISRDAPAGYFEAIASFGYGNVIEATNSAGLMVTRDGGRTWTQVANDPQLFGIVSLSWLDGGIAWAADVTGTVWVTTDYGASWTKLPKQP